jgi:hypothetical protein
VYEAWKQQRLNQQEGNYVYRESPNIPARIPPRCERSPSDQADYEEWERKCLSFQRRNRWLSDEIDRGRLMKDILKEPQATLNFWR